MSRSIEAWQYVTRQHARRGFLWGLLIGLAIGAAAFYIDRSFRRPIVIVVSPVSPTIQSNGKPWKI